MKNQQLFDKTVSVLVNAYFNGYLNPVDCAACAVGNLVAGGLNSNYPYLLLNLNFQMEKFIMNGIHQNKKTI